MANQTAPDMMFEPLDGVQKGFSKPTFIIKRKVDGDEKNDIYYLTKVIWHYDRSMTGNLDKHGNAIEEIKRIYGAAGDDPNISVREIKDSGVDLVTEGFTSNPPKSPK